MRDRSSTTTPTAHEYARGYWTARCARDQPYPSVPPERASDVVYGLRVEGFLYLHLYRESVERIGGVDTWLRKARQCFARAGARALERSPVCIETREPHDWQSTACAGDRCAWCQVSRLDVEGVATDDDEEDDDEDEEMDQACACPDCGEAAADGHKFETDPGPWAFCGACTESGCTTERASCSEED